MKAILTAAVVAGSLATPASAALIERDLSIHMNFVNLTGAILPISQIRLSFKVAFDNASTVVGTSKGLFVTENIFDAPVTFSYDASDNTFSIGPLPRMAVTRIATAISVCSRPPSRSPALPCAAAPVASTVVVISAIVS